MSVGGSLLGYLGGKAVATRQPVFTFLFKGRYPGFWMTHVDLVLMRTALDFLDQDFWEDSERQEKKRCKCLPFVYSSALIWKSC
jgi:hypothetical protein